MTEAVAGRCPSELDILRHLHAPQPELERHAEACPACAARVAEALRSAEAFHREVFPATLDAVVERSRPWRPRAWMLAPIPALAAAAALLVLVRPAAPPPGYVGVRGGLLLSVYVRGAGGEGARAASDGQVVPPDAALRCAIATVNVPPYARMDLETWLWKTKKIRIRGGEPSKLRLSTPYFLLHKDVDRFLAAFDEYRAQHRPA